SRFPHRVAVHSCHVGFGEASFDLRLEPLRTEPAIPDAIEFALRAPRGRRNLVIAVMANRLAAVAVMGERHVAIGTADDVTASGTLDRSGESAAVQQQDDLPLVTDRLHDRLVQRPADRTAGPLVL